MSPKFKSKVEQFYYDHLTEPQDQGDESLKVLTARKGAYSGDGRKSFFSFDSADIKSFNAETRNFIEEILQLILKHRNMASFLLIFRPPVSISLCYLAS